MKPNLFIQKIYEQIENDFFKYQSKYLNLEI